MTSKNTESGYILHASCGSRNTREEREYRRLHENSLRRLFDNRCANCGDEENGCDIDHFLVPHNDGGTFRMKRADGKFENNAIPLCETCNRSKGKKSATEFFQPVRLAEILALNRKMTKRLQSQWVSKIEWRSKQQSTNGIVFSFPKNIKRYTMSDMENFIKNGDRIEVSCINTGTQISLQVNANARRNVRDCAYAKLKLKIDDSGHVYDGNFRLTTSRDAKGRPYCKSPINVGNGRQALAKRFPASKQGLFLKAIEGGVHELIG